MENKLSLDRLSLRGGVAILLVFYMSSYNVFGHAIGLASDRWIGLGIGLVMATPLLLILARLIRLLPGMDLFDMLEYAFGRVLGTVITVLYCAYFIAMAALAGRYHGEFLRLTTLPNTPLIVLIVALFAVCVYLAKSGAITLGKWSILVAALAVISAVTMAIFGIPAMGFNHLLPLGVHSGQGLLWGGYRSAVLGLGNAIILLTLAGRLDRKANPYGLFMFSAALAIAFFALTFLRDLAVLGQGSMDTFLFPAYRAAGVLGMGGLGVRIEVFVLLMALLTGAAKIALCLMATVKGVSRIGGRLDRNFLAPLVAALALILAMSLFPNLTALFAFPGVYLRYAPVLQVGIPVLMWLIAEGKAKKYRHINSDKND